MRSIAIGFLPLTLVTIQSDAPKVAALAVDRGNGFAYGWAFDHAGRDEANARALDECRQRNGNCELVVELSGPACAAYATVSTEDASAYGWGVGSSREVAQNLANSECEKRSDGRSCSNNVWSCNSGSGDFKVLSSQLQSNPPSADDCLIQYEANVQREGNFFTRINSPVYRMSSKYCPLSGKSVYHAFKAWSYPGQRADAEEVNADRKDVVKEAKGIAAANEFLAWVMKRDTRIGQTQFQPQVNVNVVDYQQDSLAEMAQDTANGDAADPTNAAIGLCIAYAPPGGTPISVTGSSKCKQWIK